METIVWDQPQPMAQCQSKGVIRHTIGWLSREDCEPGVCHAVGHRRRSHDYLLIWR